MFFTSKRCSSSATSFPGSFVFPQEGMVEETRPLPLVGRRKTLGTRLPLLSGVDIVIRYIEVDSIERGNMGTQSKFGRKGIMTPHRKPSTIPFQPGACNALSQCSIM